ncbi:ABC transporter permease [Haloarchaeobius sp. HME9146]|uniref:ABC transporter permease n=1 Tax=Haloarchaeobius sp. HME9146 TaxID=2978732 RepID=UPI0021C01553|nr:ABC transporter permease [Haloarchaeobius sp. HME9146]MCT9095563.1 ABC transporter permease [Haloarchaeobius sp. HME9146]
MTADREHLDDEGDHRPDDESDPRPDGGTTTAASTAAKLGGRSPSLPALDGLGHVLTLADREYRTLSRSRWPVGLAALFAVVSLAVAAASGSGAGTGRASAVVVSLAEFSVYLVPLAALAFGYAAVVGLAERGTLDMLFALPVRRSRVLLGTYLGRALGLVAALAVGFGFGGALLFRFVGVSGTGPYARFLLAAVGAGLAFLAIAVLVSTLAREKTHALGGVLLAWVWFVFAHDLLALSAVVFADPPELVVTALVLANPADCFRVLVLSGVQTTGGGVGAALASSSLSPALAALGLLAWIVLPLAGSVKAAERVYGRR